jgi:DNA-binding response OmpR family regulator
LKVLVEGKGKVFTREELLSEAFLHTVSPTERAVDVHVKSIRDKLHECGKYIVTVRGVGYKFQLEE